MIFNSRFSFFLVLIGVLLCANTVFAQKVSKQYLPAKSRETPDFMRPFYQKSEQDWLLFNVNKLDKGFAGFEKEEAAEQKHAAKHNLTQTKEEVLTGEENENAYILFYKRWRKSVDRYVQEDGTIKLPSTAVTEPTLSVNKPNSPTSSWSLLGPIETFWDGSTAKAPWQANIYAMAVSETNPSILYACPETGGIFKTIDKGLNWTSQTMNYAISTCTAAKIHPTNPDTVYIGRDDQLIRSYDAGATWTTNTMPWGDVNGIVFKPSDPTKVFVAGESGLYRNVSAGYTVTQATTFNVNGLQTGLPTWNRNGTGTACTAVAGTNQYYRVYPFTVSAAGSYTFTMCTPSSNFDGHASIYKNAFNGATPCATAANHLASDDDANSGGNCNNDPLITVTLATGTTYYLVTTSYNNLETGGYQWTFTGPSNATLTSIEASWIQVPSMNTNCMDVFYKTNDVNTMYCLKQGATNVEFWRSTDGGNSFAASMSGYPAITSTQGRMTTTIADANRLYIVLLGSTAPADIPHIIRSDDAGLTWSLKCTGVTGLTGSTASPLGMSNGQGFYDLDILANPNNADEVIAASTSAYKSTNGGTTFTAVGGYQGSLGIHPDIQEMVAVGGDTWITTDGGINYSTDFFSTAANFSPRFKGIFASDMWGFAQGWNEDIVGGGRYHNGNTVLSETYNAGEAIRLGGGEAPTGYYMLGRPRYIAFSDISPRIVPIVRSTAATTFSFTKFPNENGYGSDASEVEFSPYCYNHIYLGNAKDFWKSTNGGITWTTLSTLAGDIRQFEISRSNPNVIYLATNTPTQLQKSIDGGLTWSILTLPAGASANKVSIALSFTDENALWITSPSNTSNNRVFKSVNGGTTWTNMTTATINSQAYLNIIQQAGTDNGVYLLGDNGKVFYKSDSEADWVIFNTGLPPIQYNIHVKPFYRDAKLRSAGDQGIWQIDFYEPSAPLAQPTVDKLTSQCVRDTFYFEDYSAFKQAGGTWAWTFSGSPTYVSATNVRNPKVVFGAIGTYDFSLTITNSAGTSTKAVIGKIQITENLCGIDTVAGKSLELLAAGDYAEQITPLNVSTNTITLSCWIKPNGTQTSNAGILFSGSNGATGINFRTANQVGYHWADGAGSYNWAGGPTLPADVWSHLALVVNGTSATVYLNGIAYTRTATHSAVNFNSVFQMGIDRSNTSRNFKGQIDEVAMYNRALTQNEVRELMNLTKNNPNTGSLPNNDATLLAYYQFNEGSSKPTYDKVGARHLNLLGTATKNTISTAPVGGGTYSRMAVTTGGTYTFTRPNINLTFPNTGVVPNGDLVVSKLNTAPDQNCTTNMLPLPTGYYIIRNYGANATFAPLTGIQFNAVKGTTPTMTGLAGDIWLYKRPSNSDGATWGTRIGAATTVTNNNGTGDITYTTGLSVTSFSQFAIGIDPVSLPVTFLSFSFQGKNAKKYIQLTWQTVSEVNFKQFEVERSDNGINFYKIGIVRAKGKGQYDFFDENPLPSINYYRLKMVDNDDTYVYSNIITVVRKTLNAYNTVVSPNPSNDGWFTLTCKDAPITNNDVNITIVNTIGQVVQTIQLAGANFQQPVHFNIPNSGVYFMTIRFAGGEAITKKLVVE